MVIDGSVPQNWSRRLAVDQRHDVTGELIHVVKHDVKVVVGQVDKHRTGAGVGQTVDVLGPLFRDKICSYGVKNIDSKTSRLNV